jgi:hypothetical protein
MDRKKLVKVLMATKGKEKQISRNKFGVFEQKIAWENVEQI